MSAVIQRWDGFLAQVSERFLLVMTEAREGCAAVLERAGWDPGPMGNAWGAIDQRAQALSTKVSDVWSSDVEPALEAAGLPFAIERAKGEALREWLEVERERTRIGIWADAGRALFQRALAERGGAVGCVRCGAPLSVPMTFRALNVPCTHCGIVNGFEPGMRMRIAEVCIHPLCEEAAWSEWLARRAADQARRRARPVSIHHLKESERAELAYWRAYLYARIRLMPETSAAFTADLTGKMRAFYDAMDREPAWLVSGRPRELAI